VEAVTVVAAPMKLAAAVVAVTPEAVTVVAVTPEAVTATEAASADATVAAVVAAAPAKYTRAATCIYVYIILTIGGYMPMLVMNNDRAMKET
jgi:hypothetical protein